MQRMHSATSELAVLACCLWSPLARQEARAIITGADFYDPAHEEVWDAFNRLDRQGMEIDGPALSAVLRDHRLKRLVAETLLTYPSVPSAVKTHATEVRDWAQRRRLYTEAVRTQQLALNPEVDTLGLAAGAATRYAEIRDAGITHEDIEAMTVEELILEVDPEPDWVIPGFLERGDRFVLTGEEGLGKSHLLRQVVILGSAGLDPFRLTEIEPIKAMVVDFENSRRQIRRRLWSTYQYALSKGRGTPGLATVLSMPRSDITTDKVLAKLHRELDACQPDVLAIGPLYKMTGKALNDDTDASPVLAALDTFRDRGIALLIEAHAGHTKTHGGQRDLRPRGSSALLGWPEFGYGIKANGADAATLVPWRGDRDERSFPLGLTRWNDLWIEQRPRMLHDYYTEDWSDLDDRIEE